MLLLGVVSINLVIGVAQESPLRGKGLTTGRRLKISRINFGYLFDSYSGRIKVRLALGIVRK